MAIVRRVDQNRLSAEKKEKIKKAKADGAPYPFSTGVAGDAGARVTPTFIPKQDSLIIEGPDNAAAIVIDNNPRYSFTGGDFASRISIVAGVEGHKLKEDVPITELTPINDAAGVYISQKDNVQESWGLTSPLALRNEEDQEEPNQVDAGKSHVTAFADVVQLVARNGGVNLYAGGVGETLACGIDNREALGVNLIYGNKIVRYDPNKKKNSPYTLQPLVKGDNLNKVLDDVVERISDISETLIQLKTGLLQLEMQVALHVHLPSGVIGGLTPSAELMIGGALRIPQHIYDVMNIVTTRINSVIAKINKSEITTDSINSRWNKTN